jgi:hypothetical protein
MKLDDFEAVFKSSVKERFRLDAPAIRKVLHVTDLSAEDAAAVDDKIKRYLACIEPDAMTWRTTTAADHRVIPELMALIEADPPDLIVAYRHLMADSKALDHSLGATVDTLTQATEIPVLLMPLPSRSDFDDRVGELASVLVVTDHITGDDRLVNWAVRLCPSGGQLYLAHVEDDVTYRRYMEIIEMIPDANTETTVRRITDKLLGRPADYIQSTIEALAEAGITERVTPIVKMGHAISDYRQIIVDNDVDLIVLNTKDEDQLAMHGMAYAIAVELQDRPLLLL